MPEARPSLGRARTTPPQTPGVQPGTPYLCVSAPYTIAGTVTILNDIGPFVPWRSWGYIHDDDNKVSKPFSPPRYFRGFENNILIIIKAAFGCLTKRFLSAQRPRLAFSYGWFDSVLFFLFCQRIDCRVRQTCAIASFGYFSAAYIRLATPARNTSWITDDNSGSVKTVGLSSFLHFVMSSCSC